MIKIMLDKIYRQRYNSLNKRVTGALPWQTRVTRVHDPLRYSTHTVTLYLGLSLVFACIDCWLFGAPWEMLAGFLAPLFGGGGSAFEAQTGISDQDLATSRNAIGQAQQQAGVLGQGLGQGAQAQQGLLAQLQAQSMGQGPNPALQQLLMSTNQNAAQTAGLMASQRGGGANPALLGRSIAQQGGALNQQAAGQGALMQAQQQLAAQQALGQLGGQMVGQGQAANAQFGAMNQNLMNAGISNASQMNAANSGVQQVTAKNQGAIMEKAMEGAGILAGKLAQGGTVPGQAPVPGDSEENDVVPTLLSPGEIVIPRSYASDPKAAAAFAHACAMFNTKKGE